MRTQYFLPLTVCHMYVCMYMHLRIYVEECLVYQETK